MNPTTASKVDAHDLVLTVHAIANFKSRAGMLSALEAVDRLRALYKNSVYCGVQKEPKGRSPGKRLRAPGKDRTVQVWQRIEAGDHWVFYVRGKVLLTVHHHDVKQAAAQ